MYALAEVVPYELEEDIERDRAVSEQIQSAASTAGSVFLTAVTWPRTIECSGSSNMADDAHTLMEQGLRDLARFLEGAAIPVVPKESRARFPQTKHRDPCPKHIRNTLSLFRELQIQCRGIT